jgi:hypothetical protein
MKKFIFPVLIATLVAFGFSNCSKYEEGPSFSLLTKSARISGDWNLVKLANQPVPIETIWSFNKDESFVKTINGNENINPAKWSFNDKKEAVEIHYINDQSVWTYTIIQLKNSSLIIELDENGVILRYEFEAI